MDAPEYIVSDILIHACVKVRFCLLWRPVIVTTGMFAVSNAVPADPVVCTKTGHVFERTLIEKYLDETGKCPMSGQEMSKDDLLPLKMGKPIQPRHSPAMSIPGILGMLHNVRFRCASKKFHRSRFGLAFVIVDRDLCLAADATEGMYASIKMPYLQVPGPHVAYFLSSRLCACPMGISLLETAQVKTPARTVGRSSNYSRCSYFTNTRQSLRSFCVLSSV